MNLIEQNIKNSGILSSKMDDTIFDDLKKYTGIILQGKDNNKTFRRNELKDKRVQGIEEAFYMKNIPENYKNYILSFCDNYWQHYNIRFQPNQKWVIDQIWINLQKKYEFRPNHAHSNNDGEGLSFVTYIKIPYDQEKEDAYPNHTSLAEIRRNGKIEFTLHDLSGKMTSKLLDIDKSYEGTTILFPNSFVHCVYPFYTSDDYRISFAGNLKLIG